MQSLSLSEKFDWPFYRAALALAIPIALQNLLVSSANLVDAMMVVALGNAATSAVGVAGRFAFLINIIWSSKRTNVSKNLFVFTLIGSL